MNRRACGYCREVGHQRPKCPLFLRQRKSVIEHPVAELDRVYRELCRLGFGPNALIDRNLFAWGPSRDSDAPLVCQVLPYDYPMVRQYYNGDTEPCDYYMTNIHRTFVTQNVKYSKQIKLKLISNTLKSTKEQEYSPRHEFCVNMPILRLDGSSKIEYIEANMTQWRDGVDRANVYPFYSEKVSKGLLAPSYDCPPLELKNPMLNEDFHAFPDRLKL